MRTDVDWESLDLDLGVISDYEIAAKYGLGVKKVFYRRHRLGIPAAGLAYKSDWDSVLDKLGKVADTDIAKELGVSCTAVGKKRKDLGIPAYTGPRRENYTGSKNIDWSTVEHLFGNVPDLHIAKQFNVTPTTVREQRRKRGIPPSPHSKQVPWDEIEPLLGTCIDRELSERYGVHYQTILMRRQELGIPPFCAFIIKNKGREIDFDFSQPSDKSYKQIARELGVSSSYVRDKFRQQGLTKLRKVINWAPIIPYLGTRVDREIAVLFDISTSEVCLKRKELDILPYGANDNNFPRARIDWSVITPYLGKMPDKEIAAKFCISVSQICKKRKALGLPPGRQQLS